MAITVAIEHRTSYQFDRAVHAGPHVVRLRPAPHCRTPITAYSLHVEPEGHFLNWLQDPFGNFEARLVFPEPIRNVEITVGVVADMTVINPFDFFIDESAEQFPFHYEPGLADDLAPYLATAPVGPLLQAWLGSVRIPDGETRRTIDHLVDLNRRVWKDVAYTTRMEPGVQDPEHTLDIALGSCRDSAWLLVQILRNLGLAARFVSGYLVQLSADQASLDGPAGPEVDFTDLHAWTEVYIPGAGWLGLDQTSGLLAGEGHIPLAATPNPGSAAPVTGATQPCEVTLEFSNTVRRIHEDPRVTLPYSDAQWAEIDELGMAVDRRLRTNDVRLTMGGEPTFVSVDDMDGAEWNIAADGPAKRDRAWTIARALADRFAPGALVQHGQGKWYPGEPLPRWQIAVQWRGDGVALWTDPTLLVDPLEPGTATLEHAHAVMHAIAAGLGFAAELCLPAYEDPLYRLWYEARLPQGDPPNADVDPLDPSLRSEDGRTALLRRLDAATGEPVGWVLPLHRTPEDGGGWSSARWQLRRGALILVPGDSPIGLRLPLDSVAWKPPPLDPDRSPFEPRPPLAQQPAPRGAASPGAPSRRAPDHQAPSAPARISAAGDVPPTAVCVELREGRVHVFLPPLTHAEHAVELLAVIEAAAGAHGGVVVEGYGLPRDPRVHQLVVAPDPGVIEVNVHPAASWHQLVDITTTLYAEARAARLGTEKFQLDGTHTGTGGGNHITLGGPTPADSPLLRRPDLLRSMVTFWQHHPSLSYLFSGRFIGPTSQAPRVDEGRSENLNELEVAFAELERLAVDPNPWLVDRLLRHLLVDITGNTHRAEFCIDKLFSPDSERGRLGLLELRAFEMPPHPQMALVQGLLVRALVSRFWDDPYRGELVRWGTELHDRFLLPWYVAADIADVVDDLRRHGYAFEHEWLAPFFEFRFPKIGTVQVAEVTIELRAAIEPWNVLGEEVTGTGTARYVDSSVERIQLLAEGLTGARHVITCNGRPVPLQPTGAPGRFVAGVRYRAWQPPSALHPTIGVHAPLVFDLVDRWSGRSLGGCTYHVVHPGGRSYDRFPVNANEAEARRASRFEPFGHTPGKLQPAAATIVEGAVSNDYPRTLDLRRSRPR
jgi:uncharacterized protein (DUF2126 family)/transglutaminase-like putative cysteine protease